MLRRHRARSSKGLYAVLDSWGGPAQDIVPRPRRPVRVPSRRLRPARHVLGSEALRSPQFLPPCSRLPWPGVYREGLRGVPAARESTPRAGFGAGACAAGLGRGRERPHCFATLGYAAVAQQVAGGHSCKALTMCGQRMPRAPPIPNFQSPPPPLLALSPPARRLRPPSFAGTLADHDAKPGRPRRLPRPSHLGARRRHRPPQGGRRRGVGHPNVVHRCAPLCGPYQLLSSVRAVLLRSRCPSDRPWHPCGLQTPEQVSNLEPPAH